MITHAQLLETVSYDPDTGLFTLLKKTKYRAAGSVMNYNYLARAHSGLLVRRTSVSFERNTYFAGRLAWFYMTGEWPKNEVDHHDTDGWNQKWENLREATRSQNQANVRRYKSNTSGKKCVYPSGGKVRPWRVQIQKDNRRISLGRFETKEAAHAAYVKAAAELHGEFARAG